MPANVIELTKKYIPMLDYQYQVGAKSAILDADGELVRESSSAKKILIPKMHLTGLRNYNRNEGFKYGVQELSWDEHEFTQDRASRFTVDALDDIETIGLAYGKLAAEFQRLHVIPELDAYRFSTYATKAGSKDTTAITKANVYGVLTEANTQMDEDEVPEDGRILFVSNAIYNAMKQSTEVQKKWDVSDATDSKGISFKVERFDNLLIHKVPQRRFKTAFNFLDTEAGGFEPVSGSADPANDAKDINFLLIHPSAIMQIMKRAVTRIFAPTPELASQTGAWGVAQNMDAWDIQDRLYHDAFVLGNKTKAIFVNTGA